MRGFHINLTGDQSSPRWLYATTVLFLLAMPAAVWAQLTAEDIAVLRARGEVEGWTFTVGETGAAQRPMHELCGAVEPADWRSHAAFDNRPVTRDLPTAYDWRDFNGCTPIRNQGGCGSCWAFGAIGTVESMLHLNEGACIGGSNPGAWCRIDGECAGGGTCDLPNVDLSEQWLVSCTASGSCSGGWHTVAYEYLKQGGWTDPCGDSGSVLEVDFPYTAADDPCGCPYPHPHPIWSWAVVGPEDSTPTVAQIKQAILDHGPVSTGVYVSDAFHAYNGGIFNACEYGGINHIVDLVGWDDNQGTEGVWILRNSWDTGWGIGGYMLIEYGCNRVGYSTCYVNYSSEDCNGNTIADRCDVSCESPGGPCDVPGCGGSPDCNGNNIPDECDVASGISTDYNGNSVPDECEQDCNGNEVPDECDVSCAGACATAPGCGTSADCQPDGMPDECQIVGVVVPAPAVPCSPSATDGQPWCDDFESYSLGTISGNNWEGWYGDPAALGTVTDEQNQTLGGSKSLKIAVHDTVHTFTGYDLAASAYWLLRAHVYVPSTMTGDAFFIVNPDYPSDTTWSVQLTMNVSLGTIDNHYGPEELPLVTDAWAEIRCEINLAVDLITIYYDGVFLASYPWTIGGGSLNIATVDLFSSSSSGFYYDDLSLHPAVSRDCNENGIPDDCEPDTDNDGTIDDCDPCTDVDGDGWGQDAGSGIDCPNGSDPDCDDAGSNETDPDIDNVCDPNDNCPNAYNPDQLDSDGDGHGNVCDNCGLFNPDQADCQPNGTGDICDMAFCWGDAWCDDCNGNQVPDGCDIADGTSGDHNSSGVPDECEAMWPVPEPGGPACSVPNDCTGAFEGADCVQGYCYIPKNRYLSIDPLVNELAVAYLVKLIESSDYPTAIGRTWWVDAPVCYDYPNGDPVQPTPPTCEGADRFGWVSQLTATPVTRLWVESPVHVTGCGIAPVITYEIWASGDEGITFSEIALVMGTAHKPAGVSQSWGDLTGGPVEDIPGLWLAPEGSTNLLDVQAGIMTFENRTEDTACPPRPWVDMEANQVINLADIQFVIGAFEGAAYADLADLPFIGVHPADCP